MAARLPKAPEFATGSLDRAGHVHTDDDRVKTSEEEHEEELKG
jgi:hypothetical protein